MAPTIELKLTDQEQKIVNYLAGKDKVAWEELSQFSKLSSQVKRGTSLKVISNLRKKYKTLGLPDPINVIFYDLNKIGCDPKQTVRAEVVSPPPAVQMRKTLGGKMVRADDTTQDVHLDFKLDKHGKRVQTKYGWVALNESCFELFQIFYENAGKPLSKESIKDKIWPQWGSKVPASWPDNIAARMTTLRTCIPELKSRLNRLVIDNESSYMLR